MQITKTSMGQQSHYAKPFDAAVTTPEVEQAAPNESFSFSDSNGINGKTVAKIAGAGLGVMAGVYFTGFSKGTGGVANALVGGVGAGVAAFAAGANAIGDDTSDPIGHSLAVLGGGAVAAIAGGTMGAMGYNFPMLVAGGLGYVGARVGSAVADKFAD